MILQLRGIGEARAVHMKRPTLLVVDDDSLILETLSRLLVHFGFNVIAHSDSVLALAELEQRNDIEIVVCDYAMPEINGAELAQAAKRKNPRMPVFILSGNHPPEMDVSPWDGWFLKGAPITEMIRKLSAVSLTTAAVGAGLSRTGMGDTLDDNTPSVS